MLSRQTRILILLALDSLFFFAEIIIGYWSNSLALVADSFHMLNDVMSLIVALYAVKLSSRTNFSSMYSYGWQRAEVLGALINGVFLLALCLSIIINALQRFFESEEIRNPKLIFIVGSAGLVSNIIGMLLFHEHSHAHGPPPVSAETDEDTIRQLSEIYVYPAATRRSVVLAAQATVEQGDDEIDAIESEDVTKNDNPSTSATATSRIPTRHRHGKNLNIRGVFLHVMGDALGNIGVMASALFIMFTSFPWRHYVDPVVSLFITIIILATALPLVRSASLILLQRVPPGIPIDEIRNRIRRLTGVYSVHEFHIWQLSDTKCVASVHILLSPTADYVKIAAEIRKQLHMYGVHSTTVQPEFAKLNVNEDERAVVATNPGDVGEVELTANEMDNNESSCLLHCVGDDICTQNRCCPSPSKAS